MRLLLVFFLFIKFLFAQSLFIAEMNFEIGKNENEILGELKLDRYELNKVDNYNYALWTKDINMGEFIGTISLDDNRKLIYASKKWGRYEKCNLEKAFLVIYNILNQSKNIYNNAEIITEALFDVGIDSKTIVLQGINRGIRIDYLDDHIDISEYIFLTNYWKK